MSSRPGDLHPIHGYDFKYPVLSPFTSRTEPPMEGAETQKFPLWIIEYVWAHKMTEVQEAVDPSTWPEMDYQALSLEDSWRLRIASFQVYSIMKNRYIEHFERVMGFLEETYRLLPRLVAPIKHMKIMFGLKTMTVMWMLTEGRGMVDIVFKVNQFFPSKLPQYRDQCSQHEMFIMRKNHLDFKAVAQSLAMDKDKLEVYIKNQMEERYGEHYAQKVEDRLLHYLHKLETMLPGDTYIDKILKKESPVTEEEKLLVEIIASDSATIVTTLKKLLHCDVASCRLGEASQSSERGKRLSESVLRGSCSKTLLKTVEGRTTSEFQPEVFRGEGEAERDVSKESPLLFENEKERDHPTEDSSDVVDRDLEESSNKEKGEMSEGSSQGVQEATSSPQFCSKHQRWVETILQECPDECSEELQHQPSVSFSSPLFQSSSSVNSSQDLTPSDLVPCPPDQHCPPVQSPTPLQTTAKTCQQANPEDLQSSGSPEGSSSQRERCSRDTLLPASLSPVVRLVDIASASGVYLPFNGRQASINDFTANEQTISASSPHVTSSLHLPTSRSNAVLQETTRDCALDQSNTVNPLNTTNQVQTAPGSQDAFTSISCQRAPWQSFSRLSRKFRRACTTKGQLQALDSQKPVADQLAPTALLTSCLSLPNNLKAFGPPTQDASTSQSGTRQFHLSEESSQQVLPQSSVKHRLQARGPCPSKSPPHTVAFATSNSDCKADRRKASRDQGAQLRLSVGSQAVLLQSKLLQPYVSLSRLSSQDCYRRTKGRCLARYVESVAQVSSDEEEEDADSSFDLNILYSSYSSSNGEDASDFDPDYKPCIKKKRLVLEYEAARTSFYV